MSTLSRTRALLSAASGAATSEVAHHAHIRSTYGVSSEVEGWAAALGHAVDALERVVSNNPATSDFLESFAAQIAVELDLVEDE